MFKKFVILISVILCALFLKLILQFYKYAVPTESNVTVNDIGICSNEASINYKYKSLKGKCYKVKASELKYIDDEAIRNNQGIVNEVLQVSTSSIYEHAAKVIVESRLIPSSHIQESLIGLSNDRVLNFNSLKSLFHASVDSVMSMLNTRYEMTKSTLISFSSPESDLLVRGDIFVKPKAEDKIQIYYSVIIDLSAKKIVQLIRFEEKRNKKFNSSIDAQKEPIIIGTNVEINHRTVPQKDILSRNIDELKKIGIKFNTYLDHQGTLSLDTPKLDGVSALIIQNSSDSQNLLTSASTSSYNPIIIFTGYCDSQTTSKSKNSFCIGPRYESLARAIINDAEKNKALPMGIIANPSYAPVRIILDYLKNNNQSDILKIIESEENIPKNPIIFSKKIKELKSEGGHSLLLLGLDSFDLDMHPLHLSRSPVQQELISLATYELNKNKFSYLHSTYAKSFPSFSRQASTDQTIIPIWSSSAVGEYSLVAEDAANLIILSLSQTYDSDDKIDVDRAAEYLKSTKDYKGKSGLINFDENRIAYVDTEFEFACLSDGKYRKLKPEDSAILNSEDGTYYHPCINISRLNVFNKQSAIDHKRLSIEKQKGLISLSESPENIDKIKKMMESDMSQVGPQTIFERTFIHVFKDKSILGLNHNLFEDSTRPYVLQYTFSTIKDDVSELDLKIIRRQSGEMIANKLLKVVATPSSQGVLDYSVPEELLTWIEYEIMNLK